MEKKRLGLALCGSYCTYETLFAAAEPLAQRYELVPILSDTAAETDSRFGTAAEHIRRLMGLTGREVVTTIPEAEPLGPAEPLDALLIAPCTGNTLARLAHGLTDSSVTSAYSASVETTAISITRRIFPCSKANSSVLCEMLSKPMNAHGEMTAIFTICDSAEASGM